MDWYKKDIPAYRRATRHLSPLENGIYDRLLNEYYATEGALPDDSRYLWQVGGCTNPGERNALLKVLEQFFPKNGDGLRHNTRADDEISEYKAKCESARSAARASVAKRSLSVGSASRPTEREIDRKKEGKAEEKPTSTPPPRQATDGCKHRMENGSFCGKPGVHKLHPQSKDWFCNEHQDG